jgi:hypothetical protein
MLVVLLRLLSVSKGFIHLTWSVVTRCTSVLFFVSYLDAANADFFSSFLDLVLRAG